MAPTLEKLRLLYLRTYREKRAWGRGDGEGYVVSLIAAGAGEFREG
ncbi:MAG: hypothetical protein HY533_02970 [Chloroflexi bacterium]|nr:hypothetical protein [Chloroflexota bacterium]